jgi:hypothetical protein
MISPSDGLTIKEITEVPDKTLHRHCNAPRPSFWDWERKRGMSYYVKKRFLQSNFYYLSGYLCPNKNPCPIPKSFHRNIQYYEQAHPFGGRSAALSGPRWARMLFETLIFMWGQGDAPLGLPPPQGERGGHPRKSEKFEASDKVLPGSN